MNYRFFLLILFFFAAQNAQSAGVQGGVSALALQPDGKVLVGGDFILADGLPRTSLARFNGDATIDDSFNPQLSAAVPTVTAIAVQSDGRILISGEFSLVNGTTRTRIARMNADGTLDATFAASVNVAAEKILLQPDGQILIVGGFTNLNGAAQNRIARLNADGSTDSTFAVGTGANQTIESIALQTDGRILIGGQFTQFNGTAVNRLARINSGGTLDTSFNAGGSGASGSVLEIVPLAGGKFLVGGNFAQYNGANVNFLMRINADGLRDATFNSGGSGVNNTVQTIALQPNGKIVIGGFFSGFNGIARNRLARLNADGTLDSFFNAGAGVNGSVFDTLIQMDGRVVIGGDFNAFNNIAAASFLTLNDAPTAANVTLGGRVTAGKRGISNVVVTLINSNGETRTTLTNPFGFYNFSEVSAGETYIISARHKRYQFSPASRVISVFEDTSDINFSGDFSYLR